MFGCFLKEVPKIIILLEHVEVTSQMQLIYLTRTSIVYICLHKVYILSAK